MCSLSETSSTGGGLYSNQCTDFPAAGTAAQARSTAAAQLAALLTSTSGKALLQQHLSTATAQVPAPAAPPMQHTAAKTHHQSAQLAALLSTESGKALMQQQISELIKHKHLAALPAIPTSHVDCSTACAAAAAAADVAEQADETTCSLSDIHPRVLSTAIAVSRTAPGSADRAAGLALLKQELLHHASLSTALVLAAAGASNCNLIETAAAALSKLQPIAEPQQQQEQQPQQQQKQQHLQVKALSPSNSGMGANGQPLTCAAAWSMLQQQRQQQQQMQSQDSILPGARSLSLLRNDTLQSTQSMSMRQDSAIDPVALGQISQGISRGGSQQMVFKRRSTNSTALRRHFSTASKSSRSEPSGSNKPQQLFKKQRKRPLMLWSSSSNLQQQFSSLKQQQQQQGTNAAYSQVPVEPENSNITASSSGATGPAVQALLDGQLPASNAAAAAPLGAHTSGVDNVLSTLARQEQQLLKLQQQLQQQRELIFFCRQTKQSQVPGAAAVPSAAAAEAVKALELELLLSNQAASAAPAAARDELVQAPVTDAVMSDAYQSFVPSAAAAAHQQHAEPEPASISGDAILTLMNLAKALMARQQPQQQQAAASAAPAMAAAVAAAAPAAAPAPAAQGWDPDVVRKLTAALLAA